ncbi:MAG: DUF4350 domain-containing protein [Cellulomonadaceae bacterium]
MTAGTAPHVPAPEAPPAPDNAPALDPGARPAADPAAATVGDGTTARSRARRRWRTWRWPVLAVAVVIIAAVAMSLLEPRTSSIPLAPDNPEDAGARALAQVLGDQGVTVRHVRTVAELEERAQAGVTVLVVDAYAAPAQANAVLGGSAADVVLVEPTRELLSAVSGGTIVPAGAFADGQSVRQAQCADPDALAAATITSGGAGYAADGLSVTVCFPAPSDPSAGAFVTGERPDGGRVDVLDDARLLTNAVVTQEGNAALALRLLGRHEELIWYQPVAETTEAADTRPIATLPAQAGPVGLLALVVVAGAIVWRARRLGPVVTEPLPVIVPSAEATRGRGRLYRRARSYGHAAAALRAGVADRAARRLGLARTSGREALVDAIVRATGRPRDQVLHLVYGPAPTTDDELVRLSQELDQLESEVHRP